MTAHKLSIATAEPRPACDPTLQELSIADALAANSALHRKPVRALITGKAKYPLHEAAGSAMSC